VALRELLLPWDAQPQEAVGISPAWARDCLALVSGAAPINVVTGEVGVTSGVATRYAPGIAGLARTARRNIYGDGREVYKISPWVGDFTIVWVGAMAGFSGNDTRAAGVANSGLSTPRIMVGENVSRTACTTVPSGGSTVYVREVSQTAGGSRAYIGRLAGTGLSFWQDGVLHETKTQSGNDWAGCDRFFVGGVGWLQTADADVYLAGIWSRALSDDEIAQISANPWQLFEPKRIWVPVAAGGTAHDGTGALSSDAATISGTAAHFTLHASSGALSSDASTIAGSANHIVVHPSSGALSSQDATLAGTALRYRQFSATGALDSASATIAGDAAHTTTGTFSATGALSAQDGTIAGTATHLTLHTATGAIQASDSTITGTAARLGTHDATGSLSADLASITGTVLHTGDGAEVVPLRTGGHAFMRERFAQARKRLALQRILSYLTEEEPAEETKRIIRAVKAGKPIQDKKPPVVMAEVSAEKIAEKLIPSRVADLAEIPDIDMQAVIKKAIRLAQERDDEDVLLLL